MGQHLRNTVRQTLIFAFDSEMMHFSRHEGRQVHVSFKVKTCTCLKAYRALWQEFRNTHKYTTMFQTDGKDQVVHLQYMIIDQNYSKSECEIS